jgi:hypothetical protein
VTVTPTVAGPFVNPRPDGVCKVDPDSHLSETDETNKPAPTR